MTPPTLRWAAFIAGYSRSRTGAISKKAPPRRIQCQGSSLAQVITEVGDVNHRFQFTGAMFCVRK